VDVFPNQDANALLNLANAEKSVNVVITALAELIVIVNNLPK